MLPRSSGMKKDLYKIIGIMLLFPNFAYAKEKNQVIKFEDMDITGKVQKPDVQIYISKMNLDKAYELKLKESFIPKIKDSIKKKPF
jgi:hypothetical protein